jgi:hypothetical protein
MYACCRTSADTAEPLGLSLDEIGNPPGSKLADEEKYVADPQPHDEPVGIGAAEIPCTENKADGPRHALHDGDDHQALQRVRAAHRGNIVETAKRDPVVNP